MAISIDDLLRRAVENKASDLHLKVGNHPYLRIDGLLAAQTDVPRVTPEEMLSMAFSMMTNRQKQKFKETAELDMPSFPKFAKSSAGWCWLRAPPVPVNPPRWRQ
jgi:Tfp pilus assembly pilus retraction ATPase PilT